MALQLAVACSQSAAELYPTPLLHPAHTIITPGQPIRRGAIARGPRPPQSVCRMRCRLTRHWPHPGRWHSHMGHCCVGHDYMGHNYMGHGYMGHAYTGHDYTGLCCRLAHHRRHPGRWQPTPLLHPAHTIITPRPVMPTSPPPAPPWSLAPTPPTERKRSDALWDEDALAGL